MTRNHSALSFPVFIVAIVALMPSNTTSLTIQKLETVEKAPIEETPEVETPTDASQWKGILKKLYL